LKKIKPYFWGLLKALIVFIAICLIILFVKFMEHVLGNVGLIIVLIILFLALGFLLSFDFRKD